MKTSAIVVSYNRENLIEAVLAGLGFADEVILVDKSSTDATRERAAPWVDRLVTVPWSPSPGDTWSYALSLCTHDFVVALSDDECLNRAAIDFISRELHDPRADIYFLPRQDYVLGRFDEGAWYWPHWCPQVYRRGAVGYANTVHDSDRYLSKNEYRIPLESGIAIVHLSHESTEQWIGKTNRYTSQVDRRRLYLDADAELARLAEPGGDLRAFAHRAIDLWLPQTAVASDDYLARVNLLRAMYDLIDHVKALEERDRIDGHELFRLRCAQLMREYEDYFSTHPRPQRQSPPRATIAAGSTKELG